MAFEAAEGTRALVRSNELSQVNSNGIRMNLRVNTLKIYLIRAAFSPFRVLETNARVDKVISDNDKSNQSSLVGH